MSRPAPADGAFSARVQPFACPYCGEEDLRPSGAGAHHCRACDRRFRLAFLGVGGDPDEDGPGPAP